MVELVIVYCLTATPGSCVEHREFFDHPITEAECIYSAQFVAAQYLQSHRLWQMSRWRCEKDKPRETPT